MSAIVPDETVRAKHQVEQSRTALDYIGPKSAHRDVDVQRARLLAWLLHTSKGDDSGRCPES
ncbi:MAG: hypothetical protein H6716_23605 [Polyangiaceae bacterium]|nr:hypothetical protein [Polyangiaceae bacterium]